MAPNLTRFDCAIFVGISPASHSNTRKIASSASLALIGIAYWGKVGEEGWNGQKCGAP
jgi:hypothetical protein